MENATHAIIMAAGIGSRMRPVTDRIPKPMVPVNGRPMIESVIDALHQNGITEIYIVTGYLSEQFQPLARRDDGIRLIENPYYASCNNISSLYMAREWIPNAVILDGDQMIHDSSILFPVYERSCYCCHYTGQWTDEWMLQLDETGTVCCCSPSGGAGGWQLHSVSFWTEEDGIRLKQHLEYEFEQRRNRAVYWDHVALLLHPADYQIGIRPISEFALTEIDSFSELVAQDPSYGIHRSMERMRDSRG